MRNLRLFCRAIGADFEVASGTSSQHRGYTYYLQTGGSEWKGRPPALSISRRGRFGNNIIQLIHAVHLARAIGATKIYIDEVNIGALTSPWAVAGLSLIPSPPPSNETVLKGPFFHRDVFKRQFSGFNDTLLYMIVSCVIAPMLRNRWGSVPATGQDVLHVHIRSGDIFAAQLVQPWWVPPPLAYFVLAIRHFRNRYRHPKIILLFEDKRNPCIDRLCDILSREAVPLYICQYDRDYTIRELLSARNLVTSVGSFAATIGLASTNLSCFYVFRGIFAQGAFRAKGTNVILIRDAHGRFIPPKAWRNSPDQRSQLINYPEEALKIYYP